MCEISAFVSKNTYYEIYVEHKAYCAQYKAEDYYSLSGFGLLLGRGCIEIII